MGGDTSYYNKILSSRFLSFSDEFNFYLVVGLIDPITVSHNFNFLVLQSSAFFTAYFCLFFDSKWMMMIW